jgi:hypothetical protein
MFRKFKGRASNVLGYGETVQQCPSSVNFDKNDVANNAQIFAFSTSLFSSSEIGSSL